MTEVRESSLHWSRAWGGFVFGSIAVTALALIAFVLSAPGRKGPQGGAPLLLTPVRSPTAPSSSQRPSPSRTHSPSQTPSSSSPRPSAPVAHVVRTPSAPAAPRPAPPTTSVAPPPVPSGPCAGSAPCVVDGSGAVGSALDRYRRAHGADSDLPVAVSAAAQRCATTAGDGPSCAQPYAIAYEPQQDGTRAVDDIGAGAGNWLLDPAASGVEVGWAYLPRMGQYVCVLLERT